MNVYVDLGCYNGDSVLDFVSKSPYIDDPKSWQIFAFDPNPRFDKEWKKISKKYRNVIFSDWAALNYDGLTKFTLRPESSPLGSSVMKDKGDFGEQHGELLDVKCFNFSQWMSTFRGKEDTILVKMDIEGAEYPVLEQMITDQTILIPKMFFVEWHGSKMRGDYLTRANKIKSWCEENDVVLLPW